MRIIRDWLVSPNTPYAIRVYWYANSLKQEMKTKRFHLRFFDLNKGIYLNEIRSCDKIIPGPAGTAWEYVETKGKYFIYQPKRKEG